jgi:hypothetical protein
MTRAAIRFLFQSALVCLAVAPAFAQTSTTSETKKFQVIAVDGNQLIVRLPEGTRELTVPADFRFTVDGKSMAASELRAGMSGTAVITTRTTVVPVTVTEVKNGTVRKTLGTSIIVDTGGDTKMFTQGDIDKRGVKIMRDGRPAQISDFRENDQLTATIITTMPPRVMTEKEVQATLSQSAAPARTPAAASATRASSTPASAAASRPAPAAASPQGATSTGAPARELPRTAGSLPTLLFGGVASLSLGVLLAVRRRAATR